MPEPRDYLATIFNIDDHSLRRMPVPSEQLAEFRRKAFKGDLRRVYPGLDNLILDKWDDVADHALCMKGNRIVGASRVVPAMGGLLPLSANIKFAGLALPNGASEMGRFIIEYEARVGAPAVALFSACIAIYRRNLSKYRGTIYGDVIDEGRFRLHRRSYLRMGFDDLGIAYYDQDYAARCRVYSMKAENRQKFYQFIDCLQNHRRVVSLRDTG
ncbi:hypothetical protein [Asticcacaulis solisilvae]|uniref:hypothetical protein n=1 Tax=Asticcacaulis solisilvae TaxID=1217274 RepID=UPI003FD89883